jgi:hypothetical protein
MSKSKMYSYDELFQEIPGDTENILLRFPQEFLEETGWMEGTVVNITVEDTGSGPVMIITAVAP